MMIKTERVFVNAFLPIPQVFALAPFAFHVVKAVPRDWERPKAVTSLTGTRQLSLIKKLMIMVEEHLVWRCSLIRSAANVPFFTLFIRADRFDHSRISVVCFVFCTFFRDGSF